MKLAQKKKKEKEKEIETIGHNYIGFSSINEQSLEILSYIW